MLDPFWSYFTPYGVACTPIPGLTEEELESLSRPDASVIKTSRRDFPYVLSQVCVIQRNL